MAIPNARSLSAVLYELEEEIAGELASALTACGHHVDMKSRAAQTPFRMEAADVIFCRADVSQVKRLKSAFPQSPIVVASRIPEISDWLDALEAGAADYCAAPFEIRQIRWVLESHVRPALRVA